MPKLPVSEIHFVCRGALRVEKTPGRFTSKWWPIARRHLREGIVFALHEDMSEPSYLQGILTGDYTENRSGKVCVTVRHSDERLPWPAGKAKRGRRYKYAEDADHAEPLDDTYNDLGVDSSLLGSDGTPRFERKGSGVKRDPAVRREVIRRATNGCERASCADNRRYSGFLDVHHILGVEKSDRVWTCVALCPNCHRDAHYAPACEALNTELLEFASQFRPGSRA